MQQYNVGSPLERVTIYVLGPLPESDSGNKYVLLATDYFSKWLEAYALPNQEANTVAEVLVKEFFCRCGTPMELHSDQGHNLSPLSSASLSSPRDHQDPHHPTTSTIRWNGGKNEQDT